MFLFVPRITTIVSSNHDAVQYSVNVFLESRRYIRESFFESIVSLNFPPVSANTHCRLVSFDNFICPNGLSSAIFDKISCNVRSRVMFRDSSQATTGKFKKEFELRRLKELKDRVQTIAIGISRQEIYI